MYGKGLTPVQEMFELLDFIGWSQGDLARALDASARDVSRWRNQAKADAGEPAAKSRGAPSDHTIKLAKILMALDLRPPKPSELK